MVGAWRGGRPLSVHTIFVWSGKLCWEKSGSERDADGGQSVGTKIQNFVRKGFRRWCMARYYSRSFCVNKRSLDGGIGGAVVGSV